MVRQWLKDIFSEPDGQAVCVAKVMAVIAFLSFLGYSTWGLIHDHFILGEFANGLLQVLLGSAGVIAGKNFSERDSGGHS
jgi:hypothetical protein